MMLASFEQAFRLQQRDANTKESKDTVLESDITNYCQTTRETDEAGSHLTLKPYLCFLSCLHHAVVI